MASPVGCVSTGDLKKLDQRVVEQQTEIGELRSALSEVRTAQHSLDKDVEDVAQAVADMRADTEAIAGVMRALLGSYQAEEAALRARLKTLTDTRKQLEFLTAPRQIEKLAGRKRAEDAD